MYGKAFVNHRISVLLCASLLAGCGFSDATNRTGGDFLASQGFSIADRDTFSMGFPATSWEVVPIEGIPTPNGLGGLWTGSALGDSIRAVVAFDLSSKVGADASLLSILGNDSLASRHPLTRVAFTGQAAGVVDTTTTQTLRVRFLFIDSATALTNLPALFMGIEPSGLDLPVFQDMDQTITPSPGVGILLGSALRDSLAARLKAKSASWLVAVIDGHPSTDRVLQIAGPVLASDTVAGVYNPGSFQSRAAWRSTQMRRPGATAQSLGWWVDGGRRLRVSVDGQAVRNTLHARLGAGSVSDSFDNSFNVLQARATLPLSNFAKAGSTDDRGLAMAGSVVYESSTPITPQSTVDQFKYTIELGAFYRNQLALTQNPYIVFDDSLENLSQGRLYIDGVLSSIPTRLSLGYGSTSLLTSQTFWLRRDVDDSMEFRISNVIRVRISQAAGAINPRVTWSMMASSPTADAQYNVDSLRQESRVRSTNPAVRQEIRTTMAQAVVQRKFSVDLDIIPAGGSYYMSDLWEATPTKAGILDRLDLIVRPRGGSF